MKLQHLEDVEPFATSATSLQRLVGEQIEESDVLDFKGWIPGGGAPYQGKGGADELRKDATAFANADGGYLVVGVEETNLVATNVEGVLRPDETKSLYETALAASIFPPIRYTVVVVALATGRGVLVVRIDPGDDPPHAVVHQDQGIRSYRYFLRRGTSNNPMTEAEMQELMQVDRRSRRVRSLFRAALATPGVRTTFIIRPVVRQEQIKIHNRPQQAWLPFSLPEATLVDVGADASKFEVDLASMITQFVVAHPLVDAICPTAETGKMLVILRVPLELQHGDPARRLPAKISHQPARFPEG